MDSGSKVVAGMLAISIFQMIGPEHRGFPFWHALLSALLGAAIVGNGQVRMVVEGTPSWTLSR